MGTIRKMLNFDHLFSYRLYVITSQVNDPLTPDFNEAEGDTHLKERIEEPPQYYVLLLNNDYTTFDFVVQVLVSIFKKSIEEAVQITSDVHHKGKGICGVYNKQIAETKIAMVEDASQSAGFPLKCVMEEV
jgi:ATP-dependent Clp protease adaptor protein ClpS